MEISKEEVLKKEIESTDVADSVEVKTDDVVNDQTTEEVKEVVVESEEVPAPEATEDREPETIAPEVSKEDVMEKEVEAEDVEGVLVESEEKSEDEESEEEESDEKEDEKDSDDEEVDEDKEEESAKEEKEDDTKEDEKEEKEDLKEDVLEVSPEAAEVAETEGSLESDDVAPIKTEDDIENTEVKSEIDVEPVEVETETDVELDAINEAFDSIISMLKEEAEEEAEYTAPEESDAEVSEEIPEVEATEDREPEEVIPEVEKEEVLDGEDEAEDVEPVVTESECPVEAAIEKEQEEDVIPEAEIEATEIEKPEVEKEDAIGDEVEAEEVKEVVVENGIIVAVPEGFDILSEAKSEIVKQKLMANGWSMSQRGKYDEELMTAQALGIIKSTLGLTIATCLSAISLVGLPAAYVTALATTVRQNNNLERINSDSYQELVAAVKADPKCQEILKKIKKELCEAKPDKKDLKALKSEFFAAVKDAKEDYKSRLEEFVISFDKDNMLTEESDAEVSKEIPEVEATEDREAEAIAPEVTEEDVLDGEVKAKDLPEEVVTEEVAPEVGEPKDKEYDVDAVIETPEVAEIGTEESEDHIEEVKEEKEEKEFNEIQEYKSIKEACLIDSRYFLTESYGCMTPEAKREKLVKEIALMIAKESGDAAFDEMIEAATTAKRLKEEIVYRYLATAEEKVKLIITPVEEKTEEELTEEDFFKLLSSEGGLETLDESVFSKIKSKLIIFFVKFMSEKNLDKTLDKLLAKLRAGGVPEEELKKYSPKGKNKKEKVELVRSLLRQAPESALDAADRKLKEAAAKKEKEGKLSEEFINNEIHSLFFLNEDEISVPDGVLDKDAYLAGAEALKKAQEEELKALAHANSSAGLTNAQAEAASSAAYGAGANSAMFLGMTALQALGVGLVIGIIISIVAVIIIKKVKKGRSY